MIETRNLRVVYKSTGVIALSDINVEIPGYTVSCIIGPNASGKTTLLKAISNILDYDGLVLIEGVDSSKIIRELRRILSYGKTIDTGLDYLGARVIDVLLASRYPVSRGFIESREDLEAVYDVARELEITHLLNRRIGELSSGELQRVVLAVALAKRPRYLLIDEPDSHLDAKGKVYLSNYIKRLASRVTIVLTTHDVLFGFYTCEYFIVLSNGRVEFQGWANELIENPSPLERAYGISFQRVKVNDKHILVPIYSYLLNDLQSSPRDNNKDESSMNSL